MKAAPLDRDLIDRLTQPGPRLPSLEKWLMNEVWSQKAFADSDNSPKDYLRHGEELVNERENILRTAASSLFDELAVMPAEERTVASFFGQNRKSAVVILDGCSLRELPRLITLAKDSRRDVLERGRPDHGHEAGRGRPAQGGRRRSSRLATSKRIPACRTSFRAADRCIQAPTRRRCGRPSPESLPLWTSSLFRRPKRR
jgi:hypothetical protein